MSWTRPSPSKRNEQGGGCGRELSPYKWIMEWRCETTNYWQQYQENGITTTCERAERASLKILTFYSPKTAVCSYIFSLWKLRGGGAPGATAGNYWQQHQENCITIKCERAKRASLKILTFYSPKTAVCGCIFLLWKLRGAHRVQLLAITGSNIRRIA